MSARRAVTATLLLASALAAAGCAHAPPGYLATEEDRAIATRLVARFDSLRHRKRIPGLAVVVLRGTNVVMARGLGLANVERGVGVTSGTPFDIASVAKPISAVVALRLAERGRLALDRPLAETPGFTELCADARQAGGIFYRDWACEDSLTLRHALSMSANGAAPGTRFWYNPPSFSWASRPIAEAGGASFSDLVERHVFRPAGMKQSARKHRDLPLREDLAATLAQPYHYDSTRTLRRSEMPPPQGDGAAGGVVATAMDLARFDVALTSGRLLGPAYRDTMWSPGVAPDGSTWPYGLGWFVKTLADEKLVWHTGLWEGAYSALYLKALERDLTLILLANSDGLRWEQKLDEAAIERSPFAAAFLAAFPAPRDTTGP